MPSLKEVMKNSHQFKIKDPHNITMGEDFSNSQDDKTPEAINDILGHNQKVLEDLGNEICQTQVFRCQNTLVSKELLLNDHNDMIEFTEIFNTQLSLNGPTSVDTQVNTQ